MLYVTQIENVDEEIKIEVEYDYQPMEHMTRHYPGCDEDVELCCVTVIDTGAEIRLLAGAEGAMVEEILQDVHDRQEEACYY